MKRSIVLVKKFEILLLVGIIDVDEFSLGNQLKMTKSHASVGNVRIPCIDQ